MKTILSEFGLSLVYLALACAFIKLLLYFLAQIT